MPCIVFPRVIAPAALRLGRDDCSGWMQKALASVGMDKSDRLRDWNIMVKTVNPGTFDVNASGAVNSSDISAVKARSGLTLPP